MRKTFAIAVFYIYLTAGAVLLEVVGMTAAWGVESPTGVTSALGETRQNFREINAAGGLEDTLFGSFSAAGDLVQVLGSLLFALPKFLISIGVPDPFVVFLTAPMFLIVGRGIIHALTGRFA